MNTNRYRIIFNKARGLLMAVAEIVGAGGKHTGQSRSASGQSRDVTPWVLAQLKSVAFGLLLALGAQALFVSLAHAQIVAYKNAPASQQPTILNAGNGVPLVDIQTPGATGLSRNTYSQFDVPQQGVILNNSRTDTQTQLGGWVQGNPWLATGTARLILNEVVAATPSLLRGYIEVAGNSAQVIVANPAGVTCDGCGFINANRATLTTGTALINGGNLDGYRVQGGALRIQGGGLDASGATHTDLIARAVEVNAALWANTLKVTTGANQVNAEHTQTTAIAGGGAAPAFALDVGQLGGMYAGKITLVGTEAGVGVRNAGQIGASAGEVILTSDGRVQNSGRLASTGAMQLNATGGFDNSGIVYTQADAVLSTRGQVDNSGIIAAQGNATLSATGVGGTAASVLGAGVNSAGVLVGNGRLDVGASERIALHGKNFASGDQSIAAPMLDLSDSQITANTLALRATNGDLDLRRAVLDAGGTLSASTTQILQHDNAKSSAQQLQLVAHDISNVQGELIQTGSGDIAITLAGRLDNTRGRLATNSANLSLAAHAIANTDGSIIHAGAGRLALATDAFTGTRGSIASNGWLDLHAQTATLDAGVTVAERISIDASHLSNRGGRIVQDGTSATLIKAEAGFDNTGGSFSSVGQSTFTLGRFDNRGGTLAVTGGASLSVNASGDLDNTAGVLGADGAVQLSAQVLDNTKGKISSGSTLAVTASGQLVNTEGTVVGKGAVALNAVGLDNRRGTIGSVTGALTADADSGSLGNIGGRIEAAQGMTLKGTGLDNSGGTLVGQNLALDSREHAFNNNGGAIAASGTLAVQSGALSNDAGLIQSAAALSIDTHGQTLSNTHSGTTGGLISQSTLTLATAKLDNTAGVLGADGAVQLSAQVLDNTKGKISSGSTLAVTASGQLVNTEGTVVGKGAVALNAVGLDNRRGTIGSVTGALTADAGSGSLGNIGGRIEAALGMTLKGTGLDNSGGTLVGQNLALDSREHAFNNNGGAIAASGTLAVQSGALSNDAGLIQSAAALSIDTHGQTLSNTNSGTTGGLISQNTLTLATGDLNNTAGFIGAKGLLDIAGAAIVNSGGGSLAGEQGLRMSAASLDNRGGQVQALGAADIRVAGTVNNTAGLLRSGDTLALSAARLINDGTKAGSNKGIEAKSVSLAAGQIDNIGGAVRASSALTLTSDGTLDNTNGLLSSTDTLNILDPNALVGSNAAGKTLAVANAGGLIIASQALRLDAAHLSGTGKIESSKDLSVKLTTDTAYSGEITANENATLDVIGVLRNTGKLQAGTTLAVQAGSIDNAAAGKIAGGTVVLKATDAHTLTNRGLIDGGNTFLDVVTLDNLGSGRIYGDHVAIAAATINNLAEGDNAPVIAARGVAGRLDLGATTINNREHALLFSTGDLAIGGALDTNHRASGQAGALNNASATIEALGNLSLSAGQINNTNEHFSTTVENIGSTVIDEHQGEGSLTRSTNAYTENVRDSFYRWVIDGVPYDRSYQYNYTRSVTETRVLKTDPGKIFAGGGMQFTTGTVLNRDSQIVAGGAISGTIGTLINSETAGERVTKELGTVTHYIDHQPSGGGNDWTEVQRYTYAPPSTVESFLLGSHVYKPNNTPTGSGTTVAALAVDRTDQAATGGQGASVGVGSGQAVSQTAQVSSLAGQAIGQTAQVSTASGQSVTKTTRVDSLSGQAVGQTAQVSAPAGQRVARITQVGALAVRTLTPDLALPNNSLFRRSPDGPTLIKTDAAFAGYRQWLSSDAMLTALQRDPATTQKRLGDGFYEQRLISEQVTQLTGRRFLDGYANDESQYQALMSAGVTYAKNWNLVPGVSLSEAQMAQLSTDIVWLVEKTIDLGNGQSTKALVPQLYARVRDGDLAPSGALIAATDIDLKLSGDLINSGTIAGRELVSLTAENISNLGGRLAGGDLRVAARGDLLNIGGTFSAEDRLIASAGHDLTVETTTRTQSNAQGSRTSVDRLAGLYVTGQNGTLVASAGHDLSLLAAAVVNGTAAGTASTPLGATLLSAGHDLTLGTVSVANSSDLTWNSKNYLRQSQSQELGSTLQSTGDLALRAGNDLTARAAQVTSTQGALTALAGRDLLIEAGRESQSQDEASYSKSRGSWGSKKEVTVRINQANETALSSTFSGNTVALQAGQDLQIKGSNVVATGDATLVAGRDLSVESATETHQETHVQKTTQSGLFSSGGVGFTIGSRMLSTDQQGQGTSAAASTVGSLEGNVLLSAGGAYRQVGSDLITPQGSIDLAAKSIDILEARETSRSSVETKTKQSGLTLAITSPVISAVQTVQQMSSAARDTQDPRMKALAVANVGLSGYNAYDAIKTGQGKTVTIDGVTKDNQVVTKSDDNGKALESRDATAGEKVGGVNLSISIGSSSSSSTSTQTADSGRGSTLKAGQDIRLTARGAGQGSDITVQGSDLAAGQNLILKADDEIKLLAAQNTAEQHSSNTSSSASVGVSIGTGGLLFNVGGSRGKGRGDGKDSAWSNTHLDAGQRLSLESGGDTTLKGAVARGEQVIAKVGGTLAIESLQDSSTYDSKQQNAGFSLSIGYGKISGSVNASKSKINSDYASVTEQSGLKAGDGGFQVDAKGPTDLKGGVIASTQRAVDAGTNSFKSAALTTSDIQNKASYSAESLSVNLGAGMNPSGKLVPGGTGAGFGTDSGTAGSTSQAGISGLAGHKAVRTGDQESGIKKIFDAEKVQKDIEAQTKITQQFGQQASKAVGDYAQSKMDEAKALRAQGKENEARAIESQWGPNGTLRLAAHTLIGGLSGGVSGAAGAAAGTLSAPLVADQLAKAGITGNLATTLTALASTAVGAAVGGTTGAGTALNEVANNTLMHKQATGVQQKLNDCIKGGGTTTQCKAAQTNEINQLEQENLKKIVSCIDSSDKSCRDGLIAGLESGTNDIKTSGLWIDKLVGDSALASNAIYRDMLETCSSGQSFDACAKSKGYAIVAQGVVAIAGVAIGSPMLAKDVQAVETVGAPGSDNLVKRLLSEGVQKVKDVYSSVQGKIAGGEAGANATAELTGAETAGSIRNVNPDYPTVGRTQNCVNCTVATDATLSGNPAVALPSSGPVPISALEQQYGGRFGSATTADALAQQMLV